MEVCKEAEKEEECCYGGDTVEPHALQCLFVDAHKIKSFYIF